MSKEEIEREKERKRQKRLDIRAIEFDWIFNDNEGAGFLKTLAETDSIDLFSLTLIRHIIYFTWSYFRNAIILKLFIPYLLYFTAFVMYATYVKKKEEETNSEAWDNWYIASFSLVIFVGLSILYFLYFEVMQIMYHKWAYFIDFWNMVDL